MLRHARRAARAEAARVAFGIVAVLAASVLAVACTSGSAGPNDAGPGPVGPRADSGCSTGFLGDRAKAPDFDLVVYGSDGSPKPLQEHDPLPLVFPPQGGRVAFVGVRATNVDGCALQLTGAVRDVSNGQVRLDSRTVDLQSQGDGYGVTGGGSGALAALSSYSNIPLCPNQWASMDIFDQEYELTVIIVDQTQRTATKTIHVTPTCAEPGRLAECRCICAKGYVLGQSCPGVGDGGIVDGAAAGGGDP